MPHPRDKTRQIHRRESARAREQIVLTRVAQGVRHSEIAQEVGVNPASITAILRRGLERRAAEEGPSVEAARQLYLMQCWELLHAWMPLALGTFVTDDETGATAPPEVRAAGIVLQLIDKIAAASGREIVPEQGKLGRIDLVHSVEPNQVNTLRDQIMASLAQIAGKATVIEAEFAEGGHSFDQAAGRQEADRRPAPPRALTQQGAAA